MICCVIGAALAAFVLARLWAVPVLGPYLRRRQQAAPDPTNWRLSDH